MTDLQQPTTETTAAMEALTERARELVPLLRDYSGESERLRRIPDPVIDAARAAGLLDALVPRRWGGQELGMPAMWTCSRILAHGDMSAAWVISLIMKWNWMACRLPLEAQEELYADRSYIIAATVLVPTGKAERVPGGFKVNGKWTYASALPNADWAFLSCMVDQDGDTAVPWTFLVPKTEITVHDDWHFAGMSGTGSCSFSCEDVFVKEQYGIPVMDLASPFDHPGATFHEDPVHRYLPVTVSVSWAAAIAMGGAERALELGRERLEKTQVMGIKRIDQPLSRVRWAEAHQLVRCARLLFDKLTADTVAHGEGYWPRTESGQQLMDGLTVVGMAKDAVRLLIDGAGTSAYHRENELQRYFRDIHVVANHVQNDWDNASERASRHMLGLPIEARDPLPTEAPDPIDSPAPGPIGPL